MNSNAATDGVNDVNTAEFFTHSNNLPCINGTLVNTPTPNFCADSKIETPIKQFKKNEISIIADYILQNT